MAEYLTLDNGVSVQISAITDFRQYEKYQSMALITVGGSQYTVGLKQNYTASYFGSVLQKAKESNSFIVTMREAELFAK